MIERRWNTRVWVGALALLLGLSWAKIACEEERGRSGGEGEGEGEGEEGEGEEGEGEEGEGEEGEGEEGEGEPGEHDAAAEWVIAKQCELVVGCMGELRLVKSLVGSLGLDESFLEDEEACIASANDTGARENLVAMLESGRVVYDANKRGACDSAVASWDCQAGIPTNPPAACMEAFAGMVAAEGGCADTWECVGAYITHECTKAEGADCGQCLPLLAEGEPCSDLTTECQPGLTCQIPEEAQEGTCVTPGAPLGRGDACDATDSAQTCDMFANLLCVEGRCQEANFTSRAGATCGMSMGTLCEGGLVCPLVLTFGAEGLTIEPDECRQPAGAGEVCSEQDMEVGRFVTIPCQPELFCEEASKTCVTKKEDGDSCTTNGECVSGNCKELVCAAEDDREPGWQICE